MYERVIEELQKVKSCLPPDGSLEGEILDFLSTYLQGKEISLTSEQLLYVLDCYKIARPLIEADFHRAKKQDTLQDYVQIATLPEPKRKRPTLEDLGVGESGLDKLYPPKKE